MKLIKVDEKELSQGKNFFQSSCQKPADEEKLKAVLSTRVTFSDNLTNFKHKGAKNIILLELDI